MYLFLLSDMLIVSDRKKSLFKKKGSKSKKEKGQVFSVRYEVEEVIRLDVVGVVTLTDLRYMKDSPEHSFKVTSPSRDHIFVAPDKETKMKWLNTVRTQILKNTPSDVRDSMIGYEHIVLEGTFFSACMIGRQDILKRLLETDVKAEEINALDSHGYTALHYAAKTGNASCMKLLCSSSLTIKDIASSRSEHEVPLHMTVTKEHAQCTNMLLEAGAKSSSRDATGRTALHRIVRNVSREVLFRSNLSIKPFDPIFRSKYDPLHDDETHTHTHTYTGTQSITSDEWRSCESSMYATPVEISM
tara:strand:- start:1129 stop:2031 length:903 start_codon:yes stop_codon:yes gene_type:complete